jgi:hypothetical protein
MRKWNKLSVIVAFLSAIMIVSVVFNSGAIDVLTSPLESPSAPAGAPESSSPEVFVDPDKIIKGYFAEPSYRIGNTFEVPVNITGVTDLLAWQINMSWDASMLNFSNIIADEFLNRTNPIANTTSHELGFVINKSDNATGYTAMGESILANDTGVTGAGRLVKVEFLITGYGWTNLTISVDGTLPTTLLNSTLNSMTFTKVDGYFSNKILGDVEGDGDVDYDDLVVLAGAYGSSSPSPAYALFADFDRDGDVDYDDLVPLAGNYGRSVPP